MREKEQGSYRLVVKGKDGASELWKPEGATEAPRNTYNTQDQAYSAIEALFLEVFAQEIKKGTLDDYDKKLTTAWEYFGQMYNKYDERFFKQKIKSPVPNWLIIADNVKGFLYNGVKAKLKENYAEFHRISKEQDLSPFKAPDSPKLNFADDYRNEFILASVLDGKNSNAFAFATMGANHLRSLEARFDKHGVNYITIDDFYNKYSQVAVDLPSNTLDQEIQEFLTDVKETKVAPTEERILGLLDKLDKKGYPGDSPLRAGLVDLLDMAKLHGFTDITASKTEPSDEERKAKEFGFL